MRTVAALLAALIGFGCAERHDATWAEAYLQRDPVGAHAGEAYRQLLDVALVAPRKPPPLLRWLSDEPY